MKLRHRRAAASLLLMAVLAALAASPVSARPRTAPAETARRNPGGAGDATVVAVIDFGLVPYHWDFLASKMPQATNDDPSDDLTLSRPPHTWLPGFPSRQSFAGYKALELTLPDDDPSAQVASLTQRDKAKWEAVDKSSAEELNYYWVPGTKVIGAIGFGDDEIAGRPASHGVGTTSSSVGNLHGTCPECLLVFLTFNTEEDGEAAIEWAMEQSWIDAITNSYGFALVYRDRIYSGSNVEAQREATERGQTVFFSAGNGQDGAFVVPNTTYFSSQEGPDWIVTVGAISPGDGNYYDENPGNYRTPRTSNHASYSGHGKPADLSGIGSRYPTAYTAAKVGETGLSGFGGTSNATPQIAGTYARALYMARRELDGPSKTQTGGVVARGRGFDCARVRRDCELGDGELTAAELRVRLLEGALHTSVGTTPAGYGELPPLGEDEYMSEGHGSYFGREAGPAELESWLEEFDRIMAPLEGRAKPLARPDGEREWMIVDSYCRQHIWGAWKGGYYIEGETPLPGQDNAYPKIGRAHV